MTPPSQIPVKYVLYSHYSYGEAADHAAFIEGTSVDELTGMQHLEEHFLGLQELLTAPGHEGLLVLFYSPGFEEFLTGVAERKRPEELLAGSENLRFADEVAKCIRRKLAEADLAERVRFVTSLDLQVILGRVNVIFAEKFKTYFVGPAQGIRFDTPKIVEAILRLRLLGSGVPVLRLDHDVIFRFGGGVRVIGDLGLFKAVACALRAYHLRLAKTTVSTFLFSASYDNREVRNASEVDRFKAWSRAFATRIYPALVADQNEIAEVCAQPQGQQDWGAYVRSYLDEGLAKQFYGLSNDLAALEIDGTEGLTSIGAHPLFAVISGALLCLSEGAILDLPPFSNFRNNVMWIDDHLKYSLHRAMRHFTGGEFLKLEPGLSDARLDDVTVTKVRPSVSNVPSYIFGAYLPTVLWGSIMDSWITTDPILKCRVRELKLADQQHWRDALAKQHIAPLPQAMLEALRVGHFGLDAERELHQRLQETAARRIEEVRQLWYNLKTTNVRSFASFWAEGIVASEFPKACFSGPDCQDDLWKGIAPGRAIDDAVQSLNDLPASVFRKVDELCVDALTYVKWTLEWPKFVQIVRSIPQGAFAGDLSWE